MSHDLFLAAKTAMAKAYAPYSKFPVGAALRCDDGRVFTGANIEVASYPEGWCAETTALGHYIMAGGGKITEIAVVAAWKRSWDKTYSFRVARSENRLPLFRAMLSAPSHKARRRRVAGSPCR